MFAVAVLAVPSRTLAGAPHWYSSSYNYVLINQDIRDALKEFGRNLSIPVVVSDRIRGQVRGEVRAETAKGFLEKLAQANGLIWYFDGSVLHINASDEFSTQIINIGRADGRSVVDEIERLELMDDRFSLRSTPNAPALRVSGPPAFIAMVKQVVASVQPPPRAQVDDPRVRIFRGGQHKEVTDDLGESGRQTANFHTSDAQQEGNR
ncbi:Type III secretion outermembrane pore forming protein (YscC,MxiD,HrcC, InvG) (plasmid) [Sinorhizobium sojae CCBAU 05684]|uniref:Type III secretion outermembrane pore forming protein (YscC,MxiD,HrcC, InvG) n=2 Tax=Sinorhizobium sojae TaxID=716925 RepID=A0A249PJK8_9HYPH|nr:Type III secretion outermembrane pore forming protein (YscC,MxiD,HrcC, InvG) [Sinorhizobium sojae CCBAU 05684]